MLEKSSRDILTCDTSASLAESNTSSLPPLAATSSAERTLTLPSDAAPKWTDPSWPLDWDHAGDPPRDPPPLPDLEPEPDEPDDLEELHLDPRHVPEPEPEEEEELNCKQHGEGDLAHLHLVGECATGEMAGDIGGMPSLGHSSATHPVCLGAVEVEADEPVLTTTTMLPPVLQKISSFSTSMAFLPAAVRWWGVCEIQTVEPQQQPLSTNLGRKSCDHGWSAMVHEVCWKGGECVQEAEHDGETGTYWCSVILSYLMHHCPDALLLHPDPAPCFVQKCIQLHLVIKHVFEQCQVCAQPCVTHPITKLFYCLVSCFPRILVQPQDHIICHEAVQTPTDYYFITGRLSLSTKENLLT